MGSLLIDRWIGDREALSILDQASVALARNAVRAAGAAIGMNEVDIASMVLVISELSMNQLVHARNGVVAVSPIAREGVRGLEIFAADRGPGIADPAAAIEGTGNFTGLGAGLSGAMRLAEEVDLDTRLGQGTCVLARKFAAPVTRRREVAILARPCKGETVIGDDAGFVRRGHELVLGLADGLGHGPEAERAASLAIDELVLHADRAPEEILAFADAALLKSRGAVMSVVRVDEGAEHLAFAGVGNVGVRLHRRGGKSRSFSGPASVLGLRRGLDMRLHGEHEALLPHEVVVMFSDGLSSRARIPEDAPMLHRHPVFLAHRLFQDFARDNDDAMVLVAG
jgi:anti-sigma regulatory factor (Ser/Thr protein kinase)